MRSFHTPLKQQQQQQQLVTYECVSQRLVLPQGLLQVVQPLVERAATAPLRCNEVHLLSFRLGGGGRGTEGGDAAGGDDQRVHVGDDGGVLPRGGGPVAGEGQPVEERVSVVKSCRLTLLNLGLGIIKR